VYADDDCSRRAASDYKAAARQRGERSRGSAVFVTVCTLTTLWTDFTEFTQLGSSAVLQQRKKEPTAGKIDRKITQF
jgi:hypothetical protein